MDINTKMMLSLLMWLSIIGWLCFMTAKVDRLITVIEEKQIILRIENLSYDVAAEYGSIICMPEGG